MVRERLANCCEKAVFLSFILIFLAMAIAMYAIHQLFEGN